jgi:hypothetical protein
MINFSELLTNYEIVSFVLEGVLQDEIDGTINPYKEVMQKACIDLVKEGKKVIIYTKRYDYEEEEESNDISKIYEFCETLKVNDVVFTNRNVLYSYMNNNTNHCHFNSSEYDIILINQYKRNIETVLTTSTGLTFQKKYEQTEAIW